MNGQHNTGADLQRVLQTFGHPRPPDRACGVLQYASVLMYPSNRNPVFAPWTPDKGGGPPTLWETDGPIYDQPWLPQNVEFMRTTLTRDYVRDSIGRAAAVLRGKVDSPVPDVMVSDFADEAVRVELRIQELLEYLALPIGEVREWVTT